MLRQFGASTVLALWVGALLAAVCLVPVAVIRYRRAGRFRAIDVVALGAVAVYAMAIWTYTLVPLPDTDTFQCAGTNLDPLRFVRDIRRSGQSLLRNYALLQAAFNVVLFAPLGFFLRVLLRRGIGWATVTGFLVSLAIELTQKTGNWGAYHCSYRSFDVDDLILNTTGALLGSLIALPLARLLLRRGSAPATIKVTLGRRLTGMAVDLILIGVVGFSLVIIWHGFALRLLDVAATALPEWIDLLLSYGVPALIEGWWVLAKGRTIGEQAVQLVPVSRSEHRLPGRLAKLGAGVGGFLLLSAVPLPALPLVFSLATITAAVWSRNHRGLSHLAAGMELQLESSVPADRPDGARRLRGEAAGAE